MDAALGWLGDLFYWIGSLFPHLKIVPYTDRVIKYKKGKHVIVKEPGIFWYWPIVTELEETNVMSQVLPLDPQNLETKDGKTVTVDGVCIFSIFDVKKYLVDNYNADENCAEVAATAIRDIVKSHTHAELQNEDGRGADKSLTAKVAGKLRKYGVEVEVCKLRSYSKTRVLNVVGVFDNLIKKSGGVSGE